MEYVHALINVCLRMEYGFGALVIHHKRYKWLSGKSELIKTTNCDRAGNCKCFYGLERNSSRSKSNRTIRPSSPIFVYLFQVGPTIDVEAPTEKFVCTVRDSHAGRRARHCFGLFGTFLEHLQFVIRIPDPYHCFKSLLNLLKHFLDWPVLEPKKGGDGNGTPILCACDQTFLSKTCQYPDMMTLSSTLNHR